MYIGENGGKKLGELIYELNQLEYINLAVQRDNEIGDSGKNQIIKNFI